MSSRYCPMLYSPGASLKLHILESFHDLIPTSQATITATVTKLITVTMSPVTLVTFETDSGSKSAILKLYDRRFGIDFRTAPGGLRPRRTQDEDAFHSFLQQGKMVPFIEELEEDYRTKLITPSAWHFSVDDDGNPMPDGSARFEAALWYEAEEHFKNETEAYAQLAEFQGKLIPQLFGHVRYTPPTIHSGALESQGPPDYETYLNVHGILIEFIPGPNLWDLATFFPVPPPHKEWNTIVQRAVDAAHLINKHGIIHEDCDPRNVIVHQESKIPFIIDMAQCRFKHKLFELWEEMRLEEQEEGKQEEGDEDQEPRDPEVRYWHRVRFTDNPASIWLLMEKRLQKTHGFELDVTHPDYDKIIADIELSKANGSPEKE